MSAARGPFAWHPCDPAWRIVATVERGVARTGYEITLADDGVLRPRRALVVSAVAAGELAM